MRPTDDIRRFIDKAAVRTNAKMDQTVLNKVLAAQEKATSEDSAALGPGRRSIIMKRPIIKLAVAAAVIAVVGLGIVEFFGNGGKSGVVWAEVIQKVEASRSLIYRESHPNEPDGPVYIMFYEAPTRARMDLHKEGQLVRSLYGDYDARNMVIVQHNDKCVWEHPMEERDLQDHEREMHLKGWVEDILSRPHTKLGRTMVEGVLCEGIETKYPIFGDMNSAVENSVRRVWVNVATGYPVRCEGCSLGNNGEPRVETVLDQFQWDVDLAASEFEPRIPADYEKME